MFDTQLLCFSIPFALDGSSGFCLYRAALVGRNGCVSLGKDLILSDGYQVGTIGALGPGEGSLFAFSCFWLLTVDGAGI